MLKQLNFFLLSVEVVVQQFAVWHSDKLLKTSFNCLTDKPRKLCFKRGPNSRTQLSLKIVIQLRIVADLNFGRFCVVEEIIELALEGREGWRFGKAFLDLLGAEHALGLHLRPEGGLGL